MQPALERLLALDLFPVDLARVESIALPGICPELLPQLLQAGAFSHLFPIASSSLARGGSPGTSCLRFGHGKAQYKQIAVLAVIARHRRHRMALQGFRIENWSM